MDFSFVSVPTLWMIFSTWRNLTLKANIKILSQKLPYKLRDKWRAKACEILEKTSRRARFSDIVKFIEHQVRITSDPVFGDIQGTSPVIKGATKASKLQVKLTVTGKTTAEKKQLCNTGGH